MAKGLLSEPTSTAAKNNNNGTDEFNNVNRIAAANGNNFASQGHSALKRRLED